MFPVALQQFPNWRWTSACVFTHKYSWDELSLCIPLSASVIGIWNIEENMHTDIKLDFSCRPLNFHSIWHHIFYFPTHCFSGFFFFVAVLTVTTMACGRRQELSLFLAKERPPTHPYQHVTGLNWLRSPSVLTSRQRLHNEIITCEMRRAHTPSYHPDWSNLG